MRRPQAEIIALWESHWLHIEFSLSPLKKLEVTGTLARQDERLRRTHVRRCIDIALGDQASKGTSHCYLSGGCRLQIAHSICVGEGGTSCRILAVRSAVVHSQTLAARTVEVEEVTASCIRHICKKIIAHTCIRQQCHHNRYQASETRMCCTSTLLYRLICGQSHSELQSNNAVCRQGYGHNIQEKDVTRVSNHNHLCSSVLCLLGH